MSENKEILICLNQISGKISEIDGKISEMDGKISRLDSKVTELDSKVAELDDKIEKNYQALDEKIESYHDALDHEINEVYLIALENKANIEKLLIPFNDRNYYINDEIAKVSNLEERLDEVEAVVGDHSEEIRFLKEVIA